MSDEKIAFRMQLNPGMKDEYLRRHNAIWPELAKALKEAGVRDYSIYFNSETNTLFAVMWRRKDHELNALAKSEIMGEWWDHMADIMQTHSNNEPVVTPLECVFHLK